MCDFSTEDAPAAEPEPTNEGMIVGQPNNVLDARPLARGVSRVSYS